MQRYTDVVQTKTGNAVSGASITVYESDGSTVATIYSDDGVTERDNPISTGGDGEYYFHAANGTYVLSISKSGFGTDTKTVSLFDPEDAGITSVDDATYVKLTLPLRYDNLGNYTDRNAVVTLRRDVPSPTGVIPTIWNLTSGKGDNTTFIGQSGGYFQVRDSSDVDTSNKGVLYGLQLSVVPRVQRNNIPYDDVAGLVIQNDSEVAGSRATDAIYVGRNATTFPAASDREWLTCVTVEANAAYGYRAAGSYFTGFDLAGKMDGVTGLAYGYNASGQIQASATTEVALFTTTPTTINSSFTLPELHHFIARQGSFGASSTVTSQYGFRVSSTLTGATNNYGFFGGINTATGRWNFYASGTAPNHMAGQLLLGSPTEAPSSGSNPGLGTPYLQIQSNGSTQSWLGRYSADAGGGATHWLKSRGATVGSHGGVSNADTIATLGFYGSDGTNFIGAAQIVVTVDGTPGTNDMPGAIELKTTADGSAGSTSRVKVSAGGNVILNNSGSALATSATNGFTYIPTCAGTPTGVPATLPTGAVPMVMDTTNSRLYYYIGGSWKSVALT